jgi:hypothetical protein
MELNLKRREPEIVLLADGGRESDVARKTLEERQIRFAEVSPETVRDPKPGYPWPTLFIRGTPYCGLRAILTAINTNRCVLSPCSAM